MGYEENKGLWWTAATLAVLVGLLLWFMLSARPFTLVLLFERVGDLKKDDPVTWKGFTIGKVHSIEPLVENRIGVTVRIQRDYASRLSEGTVFTLKEPSFFGLVGSRGIETTTPATPGRPFRSGEKILGVTPPEKSLVEDAKRWTLQQWRQVRDSSGELIAEFETSPFRKQAEDALQELKRASEAAIRESGESLEEFRRKHQPELEDALRKLDRLREQIRKKETVPPKVEVEHEHPG